MNMIIKQRESSKMVFCIEKVVSVNIYRREKANDGIIRVMLRKTKLCMKKDTEREKSSLIIMKCLDLE